MAAATRTRRRDLFSRSRYFNLSNKTRPAPAFYLLSAEVFFFFRASCFMRRSTPFAATHKIVGSLQFTKSPRGPTLRFYEKRTKGVGSTTRRLHQRVRLAILYRHNRYLVRLLNRSWRGAIRPFSTCVRRRRTIVRRRRTRSSNRLVVTLRQRDFCFLVTL